MKYFSSIPTFLGLMADEIKAEGIKAFSEVAKLRRKSRIVVFCEGNGIKDSEGFVRMAEEVFESWFNTLCLEYRVNTSQANRAIAWGHAQNAVKDKVKL